MDFRTQGADETEATGGVREDAHDPGAAFDFLVEPLEHVGRLQMLVVLAWQAVEVQRLADVRFDPVGELGVPLLPTREPRLEVLLGFFEIAPVIEPPELLAAIVVRLPRQIVQRVGGGSGRSSVARPPRGAAPGRPV